jgi:MFS family permease
MRRDLRLFYGYRLLSAAYLFVPAQVKFFLEHGLRFTEIFILNSVFNAVLVAFEVPTGALADRIGRRLAMVAGSCAMALACLVYYFGHSFAAFALAEATFALGMTLTSGADSAYLYDLVKDGGEAARYRAYEGTASSWKHIGMTLAFAAGGFLGQKGIALPYLAAAGLCGVAAVVALTLHEPTPATPPEGARWRGYGPHIAQALHSVMRGRRLRYAILYSSLIFVLLRISLWLYQPYLAEAGFGLGATGLLLSALYFVAALCSHHVERIRARLPNGSIYWVLPGVLGATYLVLGRFATVWGVALLFAQKAVDGVYSPLTKELLNREIDDSRRRATVLSVESMVRRIAFSVFAPACGLLYDRYGRAGAFYLCATVGVLGAGALLLRGRAAALESPALTADRARSRLTRG